MRLGQLMKRLRDDEPDRPAFANGAGHPATGDNYSLADDHHFQAESGAPTGGCPDVARQHQDLVGFLSHWLGLSSAQQRALHAICGEIDVVNELVETATGEIMTDFQSLANSALRQSAQIGELATSQNTVVINGERMKVTDAMSMIDSHLTGLVNRTVEAATESVSMVYALDDVMADVAKIETMINDVDKINSKTNILATNAMIEAARAGEAGHGFAIVATEVRALSTSVKDLAQRMHKEVEAIASGIRAGHAKLQTVARIDMTENIEVKDQLSEMMTGLVEQNRQLSDALDESGHLGTQISENVARLVSNFQFQDRTSQRLENIRGTLESIADATSVLSEESDGLRAELGIEARVDEEWLRDLIADRSLGEVRARYILAMMGNGALPDDDEPAVKDAEQTKNNDDDDGIELF